MRMFGIYSVFIWYFRRVMFGTYNRYSVGSCNRCVNIPGMRYLFGICFFFFHREADFFFFFKMKRTQAENSFLVNSLLWIGFFGETYTGLVKVAADAEWGWPAESVRYHI